MLAAGCNSNYRSWTVSNVGIIALRCHISGTFFSSTGLGTMGFGFLPQLDSEAARPEVPVVDIAGDGSFNMTENSLAVSVLDRLPVIVFLLK